jgi:hypothetical protein
MPLQAALSCQLISGPLPSLQVLRVSAAVSLLPEANVLTPLAAGSPGPAGYARLAAGQHPPAGAADTIRDLGYQARAEAVPRRRIVQLGLLTPR